MTDLLSPIYSYLPSIIANLMILSQQKKVKRKRKQKQKKTFQLTPSNEYSEYSNEYFINKENFYSHREFKKIKFENYDKLILLSMPNKYFMGKKRNKI